MTHGGGAFAPFVAYATGASTQFVAAVDLNGDRIPDVAASNPGTDQVSVLLGTGDGTFLPAKGFSAGAPPFGLAVADMNGDGKPDIVVTLASMGKVAVLLNSTPAQ